MASKQSYSLSSLLATQQPSQPRTEAEDQEDSSTLPLGKPHDLLLPPLPVTEIEPGLFLGDNSGAYQEEVLQQHNIQVVVSVIGFGLDPPSLVREKQGYSQMPWFTFPCDTNDNATQDLEPYFVGIYEFVSGFLADLNKGWAQVDQDGQPKPRNAVLVHGGG